MKKKVLIVEDEIIVAMEIKSRLEDLDYDVVDVVSSGRKAVEKAGKKQPDVVLMDIRLKGDMDGVDAARQIHDRFNIPVVFLTAYSDNKTLNRARITKPYGYILKPFEGRELKSNIEIAIYKHKMENKVIESEKQLQKIIDSTSEIIISFDKKCNVSTWNKASEMITGYRKKEVFGRHISTLEMFDNPKELLDGINGFIKEKIGVVDKIRIKSKDGIVRVFKVSFSPMQDPKGGYFGSLLVGTDITYDVDRHGRLLSGRSYLILEGDNNVAFEFFTSLCQVKYKGLLITRTDPKIIDEMAPTRDIKIITLSKESFGDFENIFDLEAIVTKIKEFCDGNRNATVMLDGVHYLLTRFSFSEFADIIYRIKELVSVYGSIFLLRFDPCLVDDKKLAVLKNELLLPPNLQIDDIVIGDELFDILVHIYKSNQSNILVSLKDISNSFSIVYRTTVKRLDMLESKGLIGSKKYGRLKVIFVTDKGKILLSNHKVS
jgi:PAS domain S-box-containing protein